MPFNDDDDADLVSSLNSKKTNIKNVSSEKSIFEKEKRPTKEALNNRAEAIEEKKYTYKDRGHEISLLFRDIMSDKTLPDKRSVFSKTRELDLLKKMLDLAIDVNNDENEGNCMGSLSLISMLVNNSYHQRDRINYLEYKLSEFIKNSSPIDEKNKV